MTLSIIHIHRDICEDIKSIENDQLEINNY